MKKAVQVSPSWLPTTASKCDTGNMKTDRMPVIGDEQSNLDLKSKTSFFKAPRIVFKGHLLPVYSVTTFMMANPEDSLICSGGDDKVIVLWSLKTGRKVADLNGHVQRVASLSSLCTKDGEPYLVSGSWDETVRIWPLKGCFPFSKTCPVLSELREYEEVTSLSMRLSAESIVLKGHTNRVFSVTVVNHPQQAPFIASSSADYSIRVWSLPDGHPLYVLEGEEDATWNLCVSSWLLPKTAEVSYHGTVLISGCKNSTVRVWHHYSAEEVTKMTSKASVANEITLVGKYSPIVIRTSPDLVITGHTSAVHALAPFDYRDQPYVVTACKDLDLRVFSLLDGIFFIARYLQSLIR